MNIIKRLRNDPSILSVIPVAAALLLYLLCSTGCSSNSDQPTPTIQINSSSLQPEASLPAPTPTVSTTSGGGQVYTVVGIPANQSLPLFSEPSIDSEILSYIPSTGRSIKILNAGAETAGFVEIDYQGNRGWAASTYLALQKGDLPEELIVLGQFVTAALRDQDYSQLKEIVHPTLCLRFAPYPYINDSDLAFCPDELESLSSSETSFSWGHYDGSGEPIMMTFQEYHERFVYDQDYFQPKIVGFNQEVSSGNAINNITDIFPDGIMVEYHFPEFDPQYGGMDWRSLRLVFVNYETQWYLVALVHGEWTI